MFILGPARSGTSLLHKTLCLHREAAWISNWVHRCPAVPRLAVLNRLPRRLPDLRRKAWFDSGGNAYVYGQRRPLAYRAVPMPAEGEPVFGRCGISEGPGGRDGNKEPDLELLRRTFRAIRHAADAPILINKRIANNQRVPLLVEAFPRAKFVFIVRDGRAVAYSLSQVDWWPDDKVWWYGGTPRQWVARGGDPWEICARNWVADLQAAEEGLTGIPAERRLDVRYEDLVRAPLDTLRRVARFAGLGEDEGWREELGRMHFPDRNERWRGELSPTTIAFISEIQRDTLLRYGYLDKVGA